MTFDRKTLSNEALLAIYQALITPRIIEEKMLILLRQNKISKWFSGIGQEAIAVGSTLALNKNDFIFPLHRNLGVFTARKVDLKRLFCQWQGKEYGFSKGRERSFHFGIPEYRIIGMISHLAAMLSVADGVALGSILEGDKNIALAYCGDGGASEGDFHEAVNLAAVWDLPVIFLIENNGYALSTPTYEQYRCKSFVDKAPGYGIEGVKIDGNNVLEVYHTIKSLVDSMRSNPRPILVEAITFRMRGHEEASGTKYVPQHLFEEWKLKDPIANYEKYLFDEGILTEELKNQYYDEVKKEMEEALHFMFNEPDITPNLEKELNEVYLHDESRVKGFYTFDPTPTHKKRMIDAISEGLYQMMEYNPKLILMGQDIAEYGGVFKITQGFVERFGKQRVRNTPIIESGAIGAALGLTLKGYDVMVEMQFADFVSCGFNQIVNNLAKNYYRWGHSPNVTVRMPTGAGVGAGPFHSQSNEAWFTHVPGLKVVYPSNAYDAKGLLIASLLDPSPVMYFEHKALYRSIEDEIPQVMYAIPIGKAKIVQEGSDLTVVTYGAGVHWALEACKKHFDANSIEIIDLRSLAPIDYATIESSVKKTNRLLILHEDTHTGGIGGEIAATMAERAFTYLDAPIMRVTSLDTPVPFNIQLEQQFLAKSRLVEGMRKILLY
ncbi:MAG: dehydrogenase E1 component subunit alpha/beta [Bacteroidia bacterium]|nr:dehydrogenase E1 component subunit alpha/beta [Bacteroidia bacterium]MDW8347117.1 dehydrogenase E1 component subunit alpha/beta [Bacteroidia bacterium]